MSDDRMPKRPPAGPPRVFKAGPHDPEEAARLSASFGKGFGNSFVIQNVLDELEHPRHGGKRDLVGIIVGLLAHLTPEQADAFAETLPTHLPPAAVSRFAAAVKAPITLNGGPVVPEPASA